MILHFILYLLLVAPHIYRLYWYTYGIGWLSGSISAMFNGKQYLRIILPKLKYINNNNDDDTENNEKNAQFALATAIMRNIIQRQKRAIP